MSRGTRTPRRGRASAPGAEARERDGAEAGERDAEAEGGDFGSGPADGHGGAGGAGLRRVVGVARSRLSEIARRPRHVALAAAALGLVCSSLALEAVLLVAATVAAAGALSPGPIARTACLAAAALVAGAVIGHARLGAIDAPGERLAAGERVEGAAHLLGPLRPGLFGSSAEVRMASGSAAGARLLVRLPREVRLPPNAGSGLELRLTGSVRTAAAGTPSARSAGTPTERESGDTRPGAAADASPSREFDLAAHLRRRGLAAEVSATAATPTGDRRGGLPGALDTARRRAESGVAAGLTPPQAALARGMVLGQDEAIESNVEDDFRASGLAHVLAVSGQNVMLLAALALPLLAAGGLPYGARIAVTVLLIAAYVPLAGAGPSLQRAGVMGIASLVALAASRPASRWYALLLAACVTLALNPRAASDPGWQLSFAAVAGILVLVPPLRRALSALPRVLAEGASLTVAATVATAPLLAYHFEAVSLASLPANVLALPLVAPIMWLGMLRAALAQAEVAGEGPAAAVAPAIELLGLALGPLVSGLSWLATSFAELPGSQVAAPLASKPMLALAYVAIGALALTAASLARRTETRRAALAARWRRAPRAHRGAAVLLAALIVAIAAARLVSIPDPPGEVTVSFLDVGQGDATLVQHPDGTAILFDGGPPEGRVVRLLKRAGVRRLSAVVMTHASRDHHGGLSEVVDRMPIDLLLDGGDGTGDPEFRAVVAGARREGARTVAATAPMAIRLGGLTVRILSPAPRAPGPAPEDPNPRAVVAVVSAGEFDLLLSADAESPSLLALDLPDVDAMKVPHHGSSDPGLGEALKRLRPELAAIEVGENTYGHPSPSTLAALDAAGVPTLRTDLHGTVRVTLTGGAMGVETERGPVPDLAGRPAPDLAGGSVPDRADAAVPAATGAVPQRP